MLRDIPRLPDPNLLIGFDTSDDACVYKITDDVAIVQTVDFFPPMVDDPFLFGQIAAANALSDIYAMGGRPTHAMNLLCFPNCLGLEVAGEILAGGADKAIEAGCSIAGGHSITDNEPKYGLCVNGVVDPRHILANSSAREGDALIMTKALGTGILTTAHKGGMLTDAELVPATDSMRTLNRRAAEAAQGLDVHSCTDITGFGLAGHLCEMAEGCGLTAVVDASSLPILPKTVEMARMGLIPAGAYRNRGHFGGRTALDGISTELADIMFDPQTSGGLMFAVAARDAESLLRRLRDSGVVSALIGEFRPYDGAYVRAEQPQN